MANFIPSERQYRSQYERQRILSSFNGGNIESQEKINKEEELGMGAFCGFAHSADRTGNLKK
jgi:hypothetical protein